MVEEVEFGQVRVFLVAQEVDRQDQYVTDVGQQVFKDFAEAWEDLLVPAWGNRVIYTRYIEEDKVKESMGPYKRAPAMFHLGERVMGWKLLREEDLFAVSMEISLRGDMFLPRQIKESRTWFHEIATALTKLRSPNPKVEPRFGRDIAFIFEILPSGLIEPLRVFLRTLSDEKEFLAGRCKHLEKDNEKLKEVNKDLMQKAINESMNQLRPGVSHGVTAESIKTVGELAEFMGRIKRPV